MPRDGITRQGVLYLTTFSHLLIVNKLLSLTHTPAPVNSRPIQTLRVTSELSMCMSSPRSCPALYSTMKE